MQKAIQGGSPSLHQSVLASPSCGTVQSVFCVRRRVLVRSPGPGMMSFYSPRLKPKMRVLMRCKTPYVPSLGERAFMHRGVRRLLRQMVIAPIRVYQRFISPLLPGVCIYSPTCSQYAVEAIEKHGIVYGCWLAVRRIVRCNPLHAGGYDPVP